MIANKCLLATALAVAALSAQATVSTSVSGNTTTYTENFNGGSSFSNGYFNAPGFDDYTLLTSPLGSSSSSFSFSSAAPIQSLTISFYYSAAAASADWTLDASLQTLGNTSLSRFLRNNPGPGGPSNADAWVTQTWSNLAAGNHTLSFHTGLGALKVDDVQIVVAAVPEPTTYSMLLAGLMMMGTIASRRRRKA